LHILKERKLIKLILRKFLSSLDDIDSYIGARRVRRSPKRSLHNVLWERATQQSADFVEEFLPHSMIFISKEDMWAYVSKKIHDRYEGGVCVEFGVAGGTSINFISARLPKFKFFGFDSFEGLAEDWVGHHATKGAYSQNGNLPIVNENVSLVKGWFSDTIQPFINSVDENDLRLIHIDSDTYEAAEIVFNNIGDKIKSGCLILFDELIGYPNWKNGEYRALEEAQRKFNFKYKFLAFSSEQALIEIL